MGAFAVAWVSARVPPGDDIWREMGGHCPGRVLELAFPGELPDDSDVHGLLHYGVNLILVLLPTLQQVHDCSGQGIPQMLPGGILSILAQ